MATTSKLRTITEAPLKAEWRKVRRPTSTEVISIMAISMMPPSRHKNFEMSIRALLIDFNIFMVNFFIPFFSYTERKKAADLTYAQ